MTLHNDPALLVTAFADAAVRVETLFKLAALGDAALPAVRDGLKHPDWHVRHWCAIFIDRHGSQDSLHDLVPLLTDPEMNVRLWAVHSLSCGHCKDYTCPIDLVPLLLDRLANDPATRVRKMAAAMLFTLPPDGRVPAALETSLAIETDAKLRLHVERALAVHRRH
jgi:HEAT repeat protein